jgi:hypothetical protein
VKKRTIPFRDASVAATFFEPTYQRLRVWNDGRFVNLLCFIRESEPALRCLLEDHGARQSRAFSAKCFAEVWELPSKAQSPGLARIDENELDKQIAESLGCLNGQYSAAVGTLQWSDTHDKPAPRPFVSRLLQESQIKRSAHR